MLSTLRSALLLAALLLGTGLGTSAAWADINLNTASMGELETLPGIGPAKASAILAYRSNNGPFATVDQLDDVPGIGPVTMANLRPLVSVDGDVTVEGDPPVDGVASVDGEPASSTAGTINVNTASASALEALPGIGPSKAAAIIADRNANGAFYSCDDLQRVRGIGSATVRNIAGMCATD